MILPKDAYIEYFSIIYQQTILSKKKMLAHALAKTNQTVVHVIQPSNGETTAAGLLIKVHSPRALKASF